MPYAHRIEPGTKVKLKNIDPDEDGGLNKKGGLDKLSKLANEITELQELMYAARDTAVLVVFQGPDTAGKDGAINRILSYVNVQSCRTAAFKVPTPEELAHDFLWRIHAQTPGLGGITIFNRSHYEDVLVVRVHDLVPESVWKGRFEQINEFERILAANKTLVLKFYLHISKEEQAERLLEREKDPIKAWKLSANDWKERELWDRYMSAYEDALSKCSTAHAPWRIIPANRKWFRDLAIATALAEELRPLKKGWLAKLDAMAKKAKAELAEYRKTVSAPRVPQAKGASSTRSRSRAAGAPSNRRARSGSSRGRSTGGT